LIRRNAWVFVQTIHFYVEICLICTIWTTFGFGGNIRDRTSSEDGVLLPYNCDSGKKPPLPLEVYVKVLEGTQSTHGYHWQGCAPEVKGAALRTLMLNSTDPDELINAYVKHMEPLRLGPLTELASMLMATRMPGPDPWASNKALVEGAGHQWCAIARDNWSCKGKQYVSVLKATAPYHDKLGLAAFPENTFIYVEGNSYIGEILYTTVCHSPNIYV
jgi:hypothetical protein